MRVPYGILMRSCPFREFVVILLLAILVSFVCGVLVGMVYRVYMLIPCLIALVCAGAAHFVVHGTWWSFAIQAAAIVALEAGYVIGLIVDEWRQPGSPGSRPPDPMVSV
jgi:hypothetical protein